MESDRSLAVRQQLRQAILQRQHAVSSTSQASDPKQDTGITPCQQSVCLSSPASDMQQITQLAASSSSEASDRQPDVVEQTSEPSRPVASSRRSRRCRQSLKCPLCEESYNTRASFIKHLNSQHNQHIRVETKLFLDETAFEEWLAEIEVAESCRFRRHKMANAMNKTKSYYYCSRSGTVRMNKNRQQKRRLKNQGYLQINGMCPAHMAVSCDPVTGCISVQYVAKHLCFTDQVQQLSHLRLPMSDRLWIAKQLAMKVPAETILQKCRTIRNARSGRLEKIHLVTRKDLINIKRSFSSKRSELWHNADKSSVESGNTEERVDGEDTGLLQGASDDHTSQSSGTATMAQWSVKLEEQWQDAHNFIRAPVQADVAAESIDADQQAVTPAGKSESGNEHIQSVLHYLSQKERRTCEKNEICHICGKSFYRAASLLDHLLVHSGEKPYLCVHCSKQFQTREQLCKHERHHIGPTPRRRKVV